MPTVSKKEKVKMKKYREELIEMIRQEFVEAKRKHPFFAARFTRDDREWNYEALANHSRIINDGRGEKDSCAELLLEEEIFEALAAYKDGDLDACQKELAQCGAVILRMMCFVEDEKKRKYYED